MNTALLIVGSAFVFIAAAIHLLIFFLESVLWSKPSTWKRFGLKTQAEADIVKPMAFNQGFYNVFLAIGAGTGLVMLGSENWVQGGLAIAIFACVSMVLAARRAHHVVAEALAGCADPGRRAAARHHVPDDRAVLRLGPTAPITRSDGSPGWMP